MNWPDAAFRPCEVVHNLKHPVTGAKMSHTVKTLASFGEVRIFPKEQKLIDLVRDELAAKRPVVIFVRQTDTRDVQPRLAKLIREHVPLAKPYILKNTVAADRRERVIEQEVAKGVNVLIANPELTKTGLDLVFASTLIFYEIVFNLSTMMQAAGRSLRLNQTASECKTYYLYYEGTMEETAVYLMSRKQRAAKLLNGDIGLTGLDALTEGEAGLEEALLTAIGQEETLINPGEMFKANGVQTEVDTEDAAYWNVETTHKAVIEVQAEPFVAAEVLQPVLMLDAPQPDIINVATPVLAAKVSHPEVKLAEPVKGMPQRDPLLLTLEEGITVTETDPFALKPPKERTKPKRMGKKAKAVSQMEQVKPNAPAPTLLPPLPRTMPRMLPVLPPMSNNPGVQIVLF